MNALQVFNNQEFGDIRTVVVEDKPYAVGVDVARALEYAKPSQAVIDHCKGIRKLGIPSAGGLQETNMIPEGDIYRLIVKAADQSRNLEIKAKAERFEKWIFDEVIPSIRATGTYASQPATVEDMIIMQAQSVKELKGQVQQLGGRVENMVDILTAPAPPSWREAMNDRINATCAKHGLHYQMTRHDLYKELELTARCSLERRVAAKQRRLKAAGAKYRDREAVSKLDVIADDPKLQAIFDNIVRRWQVRYAA